VHLIYRAKHYEFSRLSIEDNWRSGDHDTIDTLRHPQVFERPNHFEGVATFDLAEDGRE
jgi:NTE family protein